MGISNHLKELGRGKQGARSISRAAAADLLGQVLDGEATDLEVGAFCLAMRIKGETPEEMAGFLDAIHARLPSLPQGKVPTVVLPSYNGARKLPVLTPLLALLLARAGWRVLVHGHTRDAGRITTHEVLQTLAQFTEGDAPAVPCHLLERVAELPAGASVSFLPMQVLCPALQGLLDVRRVVGLRNSAHSLVKLVNPCAGPSLLVSSYTHPEYLHSMGELFRLTGADALLLRGTEGEPVADARRIPRMDFFHAGSAQTVQTQQDGPLRQIPELPDGQDVAATARYVRQVLHGQLPTPEPIALQVQHIDQAMRALANATAPTDHNLPLA